MKKTLSILLVLSMLVCLLPAFAVNAAGSECTITSHKNETLSLIENKAAGWSYAQTDVGETPDINWLNMVPTDWDVTAKGDLFDNGSRDAIDPGEKNVWEAEIYNHLWVVREITVTADQYDELKGKSLTSYMKHCDNVVVYMNGFEVMKDPRGAGWTDDLTTFSIPYTVEELFLENADGTYYAVVAAHVTRVNAAYWFDMSLDIVVEEVDEPYIEVTVENADQYLDYVRKEADTANGLGGDTPVRVTVTGDLDFTGKDYKAIGSINNTVLDFGGHTVSNIHLNNTVTGNQDAIITVEAFGGSVIKNLKMKDCSIVSYKDNYDVWVGAVVGWGNGVTLENITLENITVTDNCDNSSGSSYGGIGAVIGVSDGVLAVNNVTLKDVKLHAPMSAASFLVGRHGIGSTDTVNNFTVTSGKVDALRSGADTLEQLSYLHQDTLLVGENVAIESTAAKILYAAPGEYTAYLQTRAGKEAGTYDYRLVVVASYELLLKLDATHEDIAFTATFKSGVAGEERSFELTTGTIYSSVSATDTAGVTDTYYPASNSYVFGWVITDVPEAYASTEGANMPTLTLTNEIG